MVETKTLEEVLEELHYEQQDQDSRLTEILSLLNKFPSFVFGENIELDFETLFVQKYDIRHIGQETTDLFLHFWREKTNELLMKYAPKMQKWLDNFEDLFEFTVKLERDDTINLSNNNQNTYYLNPVSSNPMGLKVQDVDKSEQSRESTFHSERDVLQSVWGKTRADIMEKILNLKDIFNDCLYEYEQIFMAVF